jgi:16S rRNA (guanine1207-N2)-methyltransferase
MHPVSQIIEKNLHRRESKGKGLWINPDKDTTWRKAADRCESLALSCQDHGAFRFHEVAGAEVSFAAFPESGNRDFDWIIVNLPRQKKLLGMLLDCAASLLAEDGILWLAGENRAGIKSADKHLKRHFRQIRKLDNARHCTLFEAAVPGQEESFTPSAYREQWSLRCGNTDITVVSYPGIFAHGRLDPGTALLLECIATLDIQGDVLDFGCGAGVIGACIAANNENTAVTFLDTNALALRACEESLDANGLNGRVLASDGLAELTKDYDLIISNPPIHAGVKTENRMSLRLLESAHEHINPGGRIIIVANRHLPYENWLAENFHDVSELVSNDHFKVISAQH